MPGHLAIGDIHGCYKALRTLLILIEPGTDDVIITLGDYVSKGPDTRAVITELLRLDLEHRLLPLRGNHELLMLEARLSKEPYQRWIRSGGVATLRSYGLAESSPDNHCLEVPKAPGIFWNTGCCRSMRQTPIFLSTLAPAPICRCRNKQILCSITRNSSIPLLMPLARSWFAAIPRRSQAYLRLTVTLSV